MHASSKSSLVPAQDQFKSMSKFSNSTISKLTTDFFKKNLQAMKDSHSFTKETGSIERANSLIK